MLTVVNFGATLDTDATKGAALTGSQHWYNYKACLHECKLDSSLKEN